MTVWIDVVNTFILNFEQIRILHENKIKRKIGQYDEIQYEVRFVGYTFKNISLNFLLCLNCPVEVKEEMMVSF